MEAKKNIMTSEDMKKLEDELHDLKTNKLKENSQKIKEAREQGDLSENAEYDAAKDEQRDIAARIAEIEAEEKDTSSIGLGCTIELLDVEFDEKLTYRLVGSIAANTEEGSISIESPLGAALLKKKKGDVVNVEAPVGTIQYKVLDFYRNNN